MIRFIKKVFKYLRKQEGTGKHLKILVFGDSNSLCTDGNQPDWPTILHQQASCKISIQNESCSGRTTWFDTGELNGLKALREKVSSFACFEYVVFMLGTNDMKAKYGPPSPERISQGMQEIIDTAIAANIGKSIILMAPPPMGSPRTDEFHPGCFLVEQVSSQYKQLAAKYDLAFIDLPNHLDCQHHLEKDTIHLNAKGRLQVARIVRSVLLQLSASCRI